MARTKIMSEIMFRGLDTIVVADQMQATSLYLNLIKICHENSIYGL